MEGAPRTKLEEQASKGYSYFARDAASAPPPPPKMLTEEEAAQQQQQLKHTESGASAWNAAGTFEERSVSLGWVQEQLAALLDELRHSHEGARVAVGEVTSCSGEAHQWLVRGKKRAGFELSFEFRWSVQVEGASVAGTAKVPHAAADELDELALEVTPDAGAPAEGGEGGAAAPSEAQRQRAAAAVRSMLPALEALLEALLERCRQK